METFDFDDYLKEKLKDPEFKKQFEAAEKRLDYIITNVKGSKRQYLIDAISMYIKDLNYLNTLSTKKLHKIAKQYNINID